MMTAQTPRTAVGCPNCCARPGKACTQPTDTGRKPVPWFHMARENAADEAPETHAATAAHNETE